MPSPLAEIPVSRRSLAACCAGAALLALFAFGSPLVTGCRADRRDLSAREAPRVYPPPPQTPRVVALGTLRGAPPPTIAEVELAMFLFGVEPPLSLTIANPTGLAAVGEHLLICDSALGAVFHWNVASGEIAEQRFRPPLEHPFAIDIAPNGDWLICHGGGVVRTDASGNVLVRYTLEAGAFKPADVLAVGDEVWVTNLTAHRIEVFDAASGEHVRALGERGTGPGHFGLPRGLARTPDGQVCVVDMLNNRVQVLDTLGNWLDNVGQPGNVVGCFGRPKEVAVGPDGTIFVTDAFSQRVHAFAPDRHPLLAFGEPGSGIGELTLPSGIAVTEIAPRTEHELPPGRAPAYYVFVAEQLHRPGVRVYAWLGDRRADATVSLPPGETVEWRPRFPQSITPNPHWHAERCRSCHEADNERLLPIAPEATDRLCLSCHDGVQAPADPHPIGRPANTELATTPTSWPTVNGAIGCLTCHDIRRHCSSQARRPAVNYVLLRGYDPQRPRDYCTTCHHADAAGRFNPHRQRDATGRVRDDACFLCHTQRPEIPADGRRRFEPHLRDESSDLCLSCHGKHWDVSPRGHVDRPVPPRIRQWMLMRELSLEIDADPQRLAQLAGEPDRRPARLPLGNDRVTCYTCHNPHEAGLFPAGSELGALADNPRDRARALRTDWIDLCFQCHNR
ncbi:MAG: hypothetical protein ACE5I3_03845 [Phycisphaerae bacterium]